MPKLQLILVLPFLLALMDTAYSAEFTKEGILEKLNDYDNKSPLLASISMSTQNKYGEDDDLISSSASINVAIEYNQGELSIRYPNDILKQIDIETKAHELDPNAPTPTQSAAKGLNIWKIQSLAEAHETLARRLKNSTLIKQSVNEYNNQPATLMEFNVQPKFSKRDKKYIKKHDAKLKLWVNDSGIPVACETHFTMKGRAYLVISFQGEEAEKIEYQVNGNRLLAIYKKSYYKNSGAGESGESTKIITLAPLLH